MNDTICAIATSLGVSAISIIKVSGNDAIKIVNNIFKGCDLTKSSSHTIHYGYIIDNGEIIDEVLISIMKSPKTYTKEDVVEINCHGGIATTNKVLELLLLNGCRLAEAGEFTKRAFLNGRINLMQAEATMSLIEGKTDESRKLAISQMTGQNSKLIHTLCDDLLQIISNIEVNIDYPEYEDIYEVTIQDIQDKIKYFEKTLREIVDNYQDGKIIQDGINTVIIGRPNVGKSSILNKLLNDDKAIVTNIPGTTRDLVEGCISLKGIMLNIIDTAGIRKTNDVVEKIGVDKSLEKMKDADLILVILNNNEVLDDVDLDLLNKTKDKNSIVVINKDDLDNKIDIKCLEGREVVYTNTLDDKGINNLKDKIISLFNIDKITKKDYNYITNIRQIAKIKECLNKINDIKEALKDKTSIDMIEIDLKDIWHNLKEIIGEEYSEELLDNLFSKFCVGK